MSPQRVVGVVLVVVGVILLVVGLNSSDSFADQVSETFTGRFTKATMWYIIGGIGTAVLGLLMTVVRLGGKASA
jgi:succinate dehydrogenase hydrophobic anchor subunit